MQSLASSVAHHSAQFPEEPVIWAVIVICVILFWSKKLSFKQLLKLIGIFA